MGDLQLSAIMTREPLTAAPAATLAEAAAAMQRRGVGSAVVVDEGAVVGIITERDLVRAAAAAADPGAAPVAAWMSRAPVTVGLAADVPHALDAMLARNFRHLPVVDGDRLAGIVSLRQLVGAARLRRVDPWTPGTVKGLENVTVAETALSHIDGQAGRLVYRGYDAVQLARAHACEDVWGLLYTGVLPADGAFARDVATLRACPLELLTIGDLAHLPGPFMARLEAAIAACAAAWDLRPWHERDAAEPEAVARRIAAALPTLVAALWRAANGRDAVAPDPSLGHAANYLWMLDGARPSPDRVLALERYLVLTAEHGMNASTFTARVIASTGIDVVSAVAGAAGALAGPLHGGAPSLVLDMLDAIGDPARAEAWVADAVARGRRLMGFGHRVYRAEDPRAACLRDTAEELGGERIALARAVERAALARLRTAKPGRALYTNVEFYSAVVLERAGIPRALFTPTFAVSRVVGWTAHVLEQIRDNRIIRPSATYVGPTRRTLA